MQHTVGNSKKINRVSAIGSALVASDINIQASNVAELLSNGNLVYNSDSKELFVIFTNGGENTMMDHRHPFTHAPLIHNHFTDGTFTWTVAQPRLWYRNDIPNHPELVALEGQIISDDQAEHLSSVYPGTRLLTDKITKLSSSFMENDYITLSVSSFNGLYLGGNIFNDPITLTDVAKHTDQWLTGSTDVNSPATITVTFKNNVTYRPHQYWIIPTNGTPEKLGIKGCTPRDWVFEASTDGNSWETIDSHTGVEADEWDIFNVRIFDIETEKEYNQYRITITKWNAGEIEGMSTGLRRLWIFGKKIGQFSLPNIPSPSDEFSWVVPYKPLNIGMRNEEIGDIGYTSTLDDAFPSYRLPANGQSYSRTSYPKLFSRIGFINDHKVEFTEYTTDSGTVDDGVWTADIVSPTDTASLICKLATPGCLGYVALNFEGYRKPVECSIIGHAGDETFAIMNFSKVYTTKNDITLIADTTIEDRVADKIELKITKWDDTTELPFGVKSIEGYIHPENEFYVPAVTSETTRPYIVADNTVIDVSASIISKLQKDIVDLTNVVADMQSKFAGGE